MISLIFVTLIKSVTIITSVPSALCAPGPPSWCRSRWNNDNWSRYWKQQLIAIMAIEVKRNRNGWWCRSFFFRLQEVGPLLAGAVFWWLPTLIAIIPIYNLHILYSSVQADDWWEVKRNPQVLFLSLTTLLISSISTSPRVSTLL